jgi:hypothetical protein
VDGVRRRVTQITRLRLDAALYAPAPPRQSGQGLRTVEIASGTAVWFHPGLPCVPLRWLLIRDPDGRQEPQALLCTDQAAAPQQILQWYMLRWQVEVTIEETRAHLGIQTQRQWSDKAIARTTPALLALYSLVALPMPLENGESRAQPAPGRPKAAEHPLGGWHR